MFAAMLVGCKCNVNQALQRGNRQANRVQEHVNSCLKTFTHCLLHPPAPLQAAHDSLIMRRRRLAQSIHIFTMTSTRLNSIACPVLALLWCSRTDLSLTDMAQRSDWSDLR